MAAPYLLEEQFAEDVEALHFAVAARQIDLRFPVAVTAHALMRQWLDSLTAAGLRVEALVPETLALPAPAPEWTVVAEPDLVTVRTGAYSGFSCVPDDLPLFLEMAEGGQPHALQVLVCDGCRYDFTRWQRPLEVRAGFPHALAVFARHYGDSPSLDLLQGPYAQSAEWQRWIQPWRVPAALAAAVLLAGVAGAALQALRMGHEADAQRLENRQRYQAIFPNDALSDDIDAQIQSKSRSLTVGPARGGILPLLNRVGLALSANPGWQVQALQYHDGALYADLTGSDLQALERLRTWFSAHPGGVLDVQTANATNGSVQVRIRVRPA
jgi:general secretion pathway protein L